MFKERRNQRRNIFHFGFSRERKPLFFHPRQFAASNCIKTQRALQGQYKNDGSLIELIKIERISTGASMDASPMSLATELIQKATLV